MAKELDLGKNQTSYDDSLESQVIIKRLSDRINHRTVNSLIKYIFLEIEEIFSDI